MAVTEKELERRRRISETTKGRKGKPWSSELREKINKYWTEERRKELSSRRMGSGNPSYGRIMTEEERKKISERMKGKQYGLGYKATEETKRKISESNKGRIVSEKTRRKIGIANSIALKGITPWNKGISMSEESKKKLSKALKGRVSPNKGKKYSDELKKKMSESRIGKNTGKNHPNYIHGQTNKNRMLRQLFAYKSWRKAVFDRDGFRCQVCEKVGGYLEAHHIKSFAYYPKLRYELSNGVTLCKGCHSMTDNYTGRSKVMER